MALQRRQGEPQAAQAPLQVLLDALRLTGTRRPRRLPVLPGEQLADRADHHAVDEGRVQRRRGRRLSAQREGEKVLLGSDDRWGAAVAQGPG